MTESGTLGDESLADSVAVEKNSYQSLSPWSRMLESLADSVAVEKNSYQSLSPWSRMLHHWCLEGVSKQLRMWRCVSGDRTGCCC